MGGNQTFFELSGTPLLQGCIGHKETGRSSRQCTLGKAFVELGESRNILGYVGYHALPAQIGGVRLIVSTCLTIGTPPLNQIPQQKKPDANSAVGQPSRVKWLSVARGSRVAPRARGVSAPPGPLSC